MDSIICNIIVIYNDRCKRATRKVSSSVKDQYSRERWKRRDTDSSVSEEERKREGRSRVKRRKERKKLNGQTGAHSVEGDRRTALR